MCYNLSYLESKQQKYAERYKELLPDNAIHLLDVLNFLNANTYEKMNAYPVSEKVNWKCNNDPSMLNPAGEKQLKEIKTVPLQQRRFHKEKPSPEIPWFQNRQESGEHKDWFVLIHFYFLL